MSFYTKKVYFSIGHMLYKWDNLRTSVALASATTYVYAYTTYVYRFARDVSILSILLTADMCDYMLKRYAEYTLRTRSSLKKITYYINMYIEHDFFNFPTFRTIKRVQSSAVLVLMEDTLFKGAMVTGTRLHY